LLIPFLLSARCAPSVRAGGNGSSGLGIRFDATWLLQCSTGRAAASTPAPLQRVMYAAAWLLCYLSPWDNVTAALESLHWLLDKQRIVIWPSVDEYPNPNPNRSIYIHELIKTASVSGPASNRSTRYIDLVLQRTRLKLGEHAFSVAAPRILNQLPSEVKAATDTSIQTEIINILDSFELFYCL